ncbi:MAG: type II toxin-antitoxin system HicA family toxin [Candidatus Omnitrophica bacterium]|nr:type II toxin-antitoxin system HicA family toxin [Candidatus Omnitrophota bacterium]
MSRLPVVSGREAARAFQRAGWHLVRWRGSHMILTKEGEEATLSIPDHKELGRGLLGALLRDAHLARDKFLQLL